MTVTRSARTKTKPQHVTLLARKHNAARWFCLFVTHDGCFCEQQLTDSLGPADLPRPCCEEKNGVV